MLLRDAMPSPLLCVAVIVGFVCFVGLEVSYNRMGPARVNQLIVEAAHRVNRQHVLAIGAGLLVGVGSWMLNVFVVHGTH